MLRTREGRPVSAPGRKHGSRRGAKFRSRRQRTLRPVLRFRSVRRCRRMRNQPAPPEQSASSFRAVRSGKRTARHEDGLFGTEQAGGGNLKREAPNRTKTENSRRRTGRNAGKDVTKTDREAGSAKPNKDGKKPEADRAKCGKRRNENGTGSRKRQTERRRKNKNREKNPPGKECAWKAAEGRPASERGKTREAEKRAGKRKERKGGTTVRKKSDGPRHATADTFNEKPAAEILLPPAPWRTRSEIRAVSASGGRHPICRRPDRRDAPIGYARFACGPSRLKTAQERTRNSFFKPGAEPNAGSVSARGGKRTRKKQPFH